jgi:hypothetical protein
MPSARTVLLVDLTEDLVVALLTFVYSLYHGQLPLSPMATKCRKRYTVPASSTIDRDVVDLSSDFAVSVNGDVNQFVDVQIIS